MCCISSLFHIWYEYSLFRFRTQCALLNSIFFTSYSYHIRYHSVEWNKERKNHTVPGAFIVHCLLIYLPRMATIQRWNDSFHLHMENSIKILYQSWDCLCWGLAFGGFQFQIIKIQAFRNCFVLFC